VRKGEIERMNGKYIAIEGIDGSGATTLSNALSKALGGVRFCEPFPDQIGGLIRDHLRGTLPLTAGADRDMCLALLFCACRLNNQRAIMMALEEGHVVTDRCLVSSWVYQASVGNMALDHMHRGVRKPDLCVLIDIPPSEARRRLASRPHLEAYDSLEDLTTHAERYRSWVGSPLAHTWLRVNGLDSVEKNVQAVLNFIPMISS
jgi:dTMP kinase